MNNISNIYIVGVSCHTVACSACSLIFT